MFGVQDLDFRDMVIGFRVNSLRVRVQGLGFRIYGLESEV
jgi:hypothetical protein